MRASTKRKYASGSMPLSPAVPRGYRLWDTSAGGFCSSEHSAERLPLERVLSWPDLVEDRRVLSTDGTRAHQNRYRHRAGKRDRETSGVGAGESRDSARIGRRKDTAGIDFRRECGASPPYRQLQPHRRREPRQSSGYLQLFLSIGRAPRQKKLKAAFRSLSVPLMRAKGID